MLDESCGTLKEDIAKIVRTVPFLQLLLVYPVCHRIDVFGTVLSKRFASVSVQCNHTVDLVTVSQIVDILDTCLGQFIGVSLITTSVPTPVDGEPQAALSSLLRLPEDFPQHWLVACDAIEFNPRVATVTARKNLALLLAQLHVRMDGSMLSMYMDVQRVEIRQAVLQEVRFSLLAVDSCFRARAPIF